MNCKSQGMTRMGIINPKAYHIQSSHPSLW